MTFCLPINTYDRRFGQISFLPLELDPLTYTKDLQRAKFRKSILGHNFWLECPTELRSTSLSCIFNALFRDTPLAYLTRHLTRDIRDARDTCDVTYVTHTTWQKVSLKRALKMQLRDVDLRSVGHTSQKLWPVMDFLNFALCKSFVYVRGSSSKGRNDIWPKRLL